jgi:hypothetical protein
VVERGKKKLPKLRKRGRLNFVEVFKYQKNSKSYDEGKWQKESNS